MNALELKGKGSSHRWQRPPWMRWSHRATGLNALSSLLYTKRRVCPGTFQYNHNLIYLLRHDRVMPSVVVYLNEAEYDAVRRRSKKDGVSVASEIAKIVREGIVTQ